MYTYICWKEDTLTSKGLRGMEDIRQLPCRVLAGVTRSLCLCNKVSGLENGFAFTLGLQGQDTQATSLCVISFAVLRKWKRRNV